MSVKQGFSLVTKNIYSITDRRIVASYALCVAYASYALKEFRTNQDLNKFWTNQTYTAEKEMFGDAFSEDGNNIIGWFMAHGAEYGVYLELANDRKYAAIWPIVLKYSYMFKKDLAKIWGAT